MNDYGSTLPLEHLGTTIRNGGKVPDGVTFGILASEGCLRSDKAGYFYVLDRLRLNGVFKEILGVSAGYGEAAYFIDRKAHLLERIFLEVCTDPAFLKLISVRLAMLYISRTPAQIKMLQKILNDEITELSPETVYHTVLSFLHDNPHFTVLSARILGYVLWPFIQRYPLHVQHLTQNMMKGELGLNPETLFGTLGAPEGVNLIGGYTHFETAQPRYIRNPETMAQLLTTAEVNMHTPFISGPPRWINPDCRPDDPWGWSSWPWGKKSEKVRGWDLTWAWGGRQAPEENGAFPLHEMIRKGANHIFVLMPRSPEAFKKGDVRELRVTMKESCLGPCGISMVPYLKGMVARNNLIDKVLENNGRFMGAEVTFIHPGDDGIEYKEQRPEVLRGRMRQGAMHMKKMLQPWVGEDAWLQAYGPSRQSLPQPIAA